MMTQAKMLASYTYVGRDLVSKPGEYTQGTRQQNVQHGGLYCDCKITWTLKKVVPRLQTCGCTFQEVNF
jgi:endonuclease I